MAPLFLLVRRCATLGIGFGVYCLWLSTVIFLKIAEQGRKVTPRPL
jgi:hypothetical protein